MPLPYFNGFIDEFYFWNRPVNQEEVSFLYDNFFDNELVSNISYEGCDKSYSVEVNGTTYNIENPTGVETIELESSCDSIVNIDLLFFDSSENSLEYVRCQGDGFEVVIDGVSYNEANPSGMQVLTNEAGCDSLLNVVLDFRECEDCLGTLPSFMLQINRDNSLYQVVKNGEVIHSRLELNEAIAQVYDILNYENQARNNRFKQTINYDNIERLLSKMTNNTSLKF